MSDLLSDGQDWLAGQLNSYASQSVTYQRTGETSFSVVATIGSTKWDLDETSNVNSAFETRDYLVKTTDMKFGSTAFLPKRDDKVVEVKGGKTYTYNVIEQPGIPAYRFSNSNKTFVRIHTKLAKVE